jgi:hypothetical protein
MPLNILTVPSPPGAPETSPVSVGTAEISICLPLLLFWIEEHAAISTAANKRNGCFMIDYIFGLNSFILCFGTRATASFLTTKVLPGVYSVIVYFTINGFP